MAFFEHRGCRLYFEEHGAGSPVLLVHGLGSSTLDWELQIPVLAGRHRVIADSRHATPLDQPEHFNRSLLAFLQEVENTAATSSKD